MYPSISFKNQENDHILNQNRSGMTAFERQWISKIDTLVVEKLKRGESIQVADLALAFNLSERQIFRRLKQTTGKTPNQYIQEHRLNWARELLRTSEYELSLDQVATKVGYKRSDYLKQLLEQA